MYNSKESMVNISELKHSVEGQQQQPSLAFNPLYASKHHHSLSNKKGILKKSHNMKRKLNKVTFVGVYVRVFRTFTDLEVPIVKQSIDLNTPVPTKRFSVPTLTIPVIPNTENRSINQRPLKIHRPNITSSNKNVLPKEANIFSKPTSPLRGFVIPQLQSNNSYPQCASVR